MLNKIRISINYLNLIAAIFLSASLILWVPMQRPALYLFFLSYFIEIFTDQKWKFVKFDKRSYWYLAVFGFFLLAFLYMPFENTSNYFGKVVERRLALFAFALISLFGVNKLYRLSYFLNTFIVTAVSAIIYLILFRIGISEFITNPMRIQIFNLARVEWVSTHMIFNFYLNMSLIASWFILTRSWRQLVWWHRYMYIGAMTFIFCTVAVSEGRSGFLISILLMLGFLFFEIWKRRRIVGIIVALIIPFAVIGLASQKERLSEKMMRSEARLFLWKSACEVISTSPILGHGISDTQNLYTERRIINQTEEFREEAKHYVQVDAHDQYLQTMMEFGIPGLLLLLFIYLYPLFIVDKDRLLMTFFIIATSMFQSIFDVFITNTFSVFFCLLILFMLFVPNDISIRKHFVNANLAVS